MAGTPEGGEATPSQPAPEADITRLREQSGRVVRWLQRANTVLATLAGLTMVALLGWTVVDILGRSMFSRPLRGTVELTELAVVVLVYLGLARTEDRDAHISADLLFVRLSPTGQLLSRIFAGVVASVVITAMTWRLYDYGNQLDAGGYTTGILRLPMYPVALLAVLGSAAFGLAVLVNLALSVRALVGRR
jgi:TRAP-type transport system small permease protein